MASKQDMDANYSFVDRIFRLSVGETADFTNALYQGDFSLPLEVAQRRKHEYIAKSLNIKQGSKVLDMGCGWGPFLMYLKEIGAEGIGVTLSDGQFYSCRRNDLNVHMMDLREVTADTFGKFDAIVCIGAMEHLCSIPEWQQGQQENIYKRFFQNAHNLLNKNGRIYVQTMTLGKNCVPYESFDINASKDSDEYLLALMEIEQPGSWIPENQTQVENMAAEYFQVVDKINGRLDYVETIKQWKRRFRKFHLTKYLIYISLIPRFIKDKEFRYQLNILREDPNKKCFERELMDHFRFVFAKT
jgi:cyclopropane-fatty-acyl-phospholipid synthase